MRNKKSNKLLTALVLGIGSLCLFNPITTNAEDVKSYNLQLTKFPYYNHSSVKIRLVDSSDDIVAYCIKYGAKLSTYDYNDTHDVVDGADATYQDWKDLAITINDKLAVGDSSVIDTVMSLSEYEAFLTSKGYNVTTGNYQKYANSTKKTLTNMEPDEVENEKYYIDENGNSKVYESANTLKYKDPNRAVFSTFNLNPIVDSAYDGSGTWTSGGLNALSFINYYINKEQGGEEYSPEEIADAKTRTIQTLTWAAQYHKLYAVDNGSRNAMQVVFDSEIDTTSNYLQYKTHSASLLSLLNDIKYSQSITFYKNFVWKMNNLTIIPSFSYTDVYTARANPIALYWDGSKYTATVNDENGVLNYYTYNFSDPSINVKNNGNGTITITSDKAFSNVVTNSYIGTDGLIKGADNTLLPADCKLPEVTTYKWSNSQTVPIWIQFTKELPHSYEQFGCSWYCGNYNQTLDESVWGVGANNYHYCNICQKLGTLDTTKTCEHINGQDYRFCTLCGSICEKYYNGDKSENWYVCTKHRHIDSSSYVASLGGHEIYYDTCPTCGNEVKYEGDLVICLSGEHIFTEDVDNTDYPFYEWNLYEKPMYAEIVKCQKVDKHRCNAPTGMSCLNPPTMSCNPIYDGDCGHHYDLINIKTLATYSNWQELGSLGPDTTDGLVDPQSSFIGIKTVVNNGVADTSVETQLINEEGQVVDVIVPGEMYKIRYTYTYTGNSKGFKVNYDGSYTGYKYTFNYNARLTTREANTNKPTDSIYSLRSGDKISGSFQYDKYSLALDKTPVTIYGDFTAIDTTSTGTRETYTWNSGNSWNDNVWIDAESGTIDGFTHKSETDIKNSSDTKHVTNVTKNSDGTVTITWVYESSYEVFENPVCVAKAYISVGKNTNDNKTYFGGAYDYYPIDDNEQKVGGSGYFDRYVVITNNVEKSSWASDTKLWQTNVDISFNKDDGVVLNTGAGITEPVDISDKKEMNYNLYYTINLTHDKAYIYDVKSSSQMEEDHNNGKREKAYEEKETEIELTGSNAINLEFDIATDLSIKYSDKNNNEIYSGDLIPIDHIQTGNTHIQRTIPAILNITENGNATFEVSPTLNYNKLVYESKYSKPAIGAKENGAYKISITLDGSLYNNNNVVKTNGSTKVTDTVYSANNPKNNKPYSISNANNYTSITQFSLKLADNKVYTIQDTNIKNNYNEWHFDYNTSLVNNKVTYPNYRKSAKFFKYSSTDYKNYTTGLQGNSSYSNISGTTSSYKNESKGQTEKYYIKEVLFRSNYTKKENLGDNDGWINMVTNNSKAIVNAGEGFEIKVTVEYSNSLLQNYVSRYNGTDDAVSSSYTNASSKLSGKTKQFCNVSYLTGYNLTDRNGLNQSDKNAGYNVKGSNVFYDLYVNMSDNPNTVYSYSGIYDTPQIFDIEIDDTSNSNTTTITYTMKVSTENGVASSYQSMKFYTNQLAPDKESNGTNGHYITIWTPIVSATGFEYPNTILNRYIGDVMQIGYTIKSTTDSIVHIVQ